MDPKFLTKHPCRCYSPLTLPYLTPFSLPCPVLGPVPEHIRQYVASLDYTADVELLRRTIGAAIPETSLLTLRVCTLMLQLGEG